MNNEQNYTEQPFNLETALKHPEWVYFRNGEKPLEWHWFEKGKENNFPIISIDIRGNKISNCKKGFFNADEKVHGADLILRVPYQTIFVRILKNGDAYRGKEDPKIEMKDTNEQFIAIVPVKIPAI